VFVTETCTYEKRPIYTKRGLYIWKETLKQRLTKRRVYCSIQHVYKRSIHAYMYKETYICEKRSIYMKRDLQNVVCIVQFNT